MRALILALVAIGACSEITPPADDANVAALSAASDALRAELEVARTATRVVLDSLPVSNVTARIRGEVLELDRVAGALAVATLAERNALREAR